MIGEVLGCEVLVSIFILLGPDSLMQACLVCKSWRSAIHSSAFRAAWARRSGPCVLLTPYYCYWKHLPRPHHVRIWSPISRALSPLPPWLKIPFPPGCFDIVSSSRGLILVRLPATSAAADDVAADLAVGNPATEEWVRIPLLQPQKFRGRMYNLLAEPHSGEFKVVDYMNEHVYHSRSRSWKWSSQEDIWMKEDLGGVAGDPDPDAVKERLLGDREWGMGCCPFVWEHKGQHYISQPARVSGLRVLYRVWLLEPRTGCREVSSSLVDFTEMEIDLDDSLVLECHAEGNLLTVIGQCRDRYDNGTGTDGYEDGCDREAVPAAIYDVESNELVLIRSTKELHYRRAVVYHPSLLMPSGGVPLTPDPHQEHKLVTGLKRKREQLEPDIPGFRQHRWNQVREDVERVEDIFFLGEEASMRDLQKQEPVVQVKERLVCH